MLPPELLPLHVQLPVLHRLRRVLRRRQRAGRPAELLLDMSSHPVHPDTEEIWRTLKDRLRQFLRTRIPSAADVEDVLQTVFLRIHQNVGALRESDRLESWVFQIARNAAADHFRRRRLEPLDVESLPARGDDGDADNFNAEVATCLDAMIEGLPADMQRTVAMYERLGMSQQEIALKESISLSGAKSRIQRGRKLLKKMLDDCCQFELDRFGNVLQWETSDERCSATEHRPCEPR